MFAGTLGRSQFFLRSGGLGLIETIVLAVCIGVQHEAFSGPPGEGRYRPAATAFLVGLFFGYKRISLAIRRNRDAGGGDMLAGIYIVCTCMALVLQVQALIVRTSDGPTTGMEYAGLVYLVLGVLWSYLLFARSAPAEAGSRVATASLPDRPEMRDAAAASRLSLAMEQVIAGERSIPAASLPARAAGFLGTARQAPVPRQRSEFGRRGLK